MVIESPFGITRAGKICHFVFLLCGFLALAACGITAPRSSEGFADLDSPEFIDADRTVTLSMGRALLRFLASHIDDDPELARLLRGLDGVRIRTFEIDGGPSRVATRMNQMSAQLQAQGWEPVLLERGQQEELHLLLKSRDGLIRGLTFLCSDGEAEADVINLMGDIPPARFGDIILALEIDAPGVGDVRLADAAN